MVGASVSNLSYRRIVFLNSLPLNAFGLGIYTSIGLDVYKTSAEDVKWLVKDWVRAGAKTECYIRHPSTVELLNKLLGLSMKPSTKLYRYQEGDKIIVVSLKKPIRGKEVTVQEDDLEFYIIGIRQDEW